MAPQPVPGRRSGSQAPDFGRVVTAVRIIAFIFTRLQDDDG